jgi:hypothetical protein
MTMLFTILGPRILWDADTGGAGSGTGGEGGSEGSGGESAGSQGQGEDQGQGQGGQDGGQPGPVPYERFKEINDKLKSAESTLAKLEQAEKDRKEKEAKEQGQWKELAEKREAELKAARLEKERLEVATRKGLPIDLVDRIKGESAEEMEKDADNLLQFLKPAEGHGVPPAGKGGSSKPLDMSKMSPEDIRKNADKLWEKNVA